LLCLPQLLQFTATPPCCPPAELCLQSMLAPFGPWRPPPLVEKVEKERRHADTKFTACTAIHEPPIPMLHGQCRQRMSSCQLMLKTPGPLCHGHNTSSPTLVSMQVSMPMANHCRQLRLVKSEHAQTSWTTTEGLHPLPPTPNTTEGLVARLRRQCTSQHAGWGCKGQHA
jgi:hypothetical protein